MVVRSLILPKTPITIPKIAPNVVGSPKTPNLFLKAAGRVSDAFTSFSFALIAL